MDAQRKGSTELKEHTGRMNIEFEVRFGFIPTNFEFQYLVKNSSILQYFSQISCILFLLIEYRNKGY